jgi:dodecin
MGMDHRTYSIIELVGISDISYDDAAKRAIARASQTLKGLGWFKITDLRGLIRDGGLAEYQVTLQVGFRLLREDELAAGADTGTGGGED